MIKAIDLYNSGNLFSKAKIFRHYSERLVSCTQENETIRLDLISSHSYNEVKNLGLKQMHMGLIVLGIKGMHREGLGVKPFVSLYDSRFTNLEKAILGCMEVDMNNNKQLVYFVPDYLIATRKFVKRSTTFKNE